MKNYRLSAAAQEDLRKIKGYSLTTWGKQQTQSYLAAIETTLEKLTFSPELDDCVSVCVVSKLNSI